jgi:hypothetical protein
VVVVLKVDDTRWWVRMSGFVSWKWRYCCPGMMVARAVNRDKGAEAACHRSLIKRNEVRSYEPEMLPTYPLSIPEQGEAGRVLGKQLGALRQL